MSDREEDLIKQISLGNKSAFDIIFRKYYVPLRNYAFRILNDSTMAEDIIQDVFFKLWQKHEQLLNVKNPGGYIRSAVHNECISLLRKNSGIQVFSIENSTILEFENIYAEILQYQDTFFDKELNSNIARIIDKLPDKCRTVFTLSRSFGFKNKEIAEHLEISVKAVEKHITKALCIISEEIKPYLTLFIALFLRHF